MTLQAIGSAALLLLLRCSNLILDLDLDLDLLAMTLQAARSACLLLLLWDLLPAMLLDLLSAALLLLVLSAVKLLEKLMLLDLLLESCNWRARPPCPS